MKTILYAMSKHMQKNSDKIPKDFPNLPGEDRVRRVRDMEYTGSDGAVLHMDAFMPAADGSTGGNVVSEVLEALEALEASEVSEAAGKGLPVIIYLHGGGLMVGNREMSAAISRLFADHGYLVLVPDYRLITETDLTGMLSDVSAGFEYAVKCAVRELRGDPDRIYLVTESAGSFLGVYSAAMSRSDKLQSVMGCSMTHIDIKKMVCFSGMFYTLRKDKIGLTYPLQLYSRRLRDKEFMAAMHPECPDVILNLPPMLLTTGDADFLKRYTFDFAEALRMNGKSSRLISYSGNKELTHAFPAIKPYLKETRELIDRISSEFLNDR